MDDDLGTINWLWHFTTWAAANQDHASGLLPISAFEEVPCPADVELWNGCGQFLTGSTFVAAVQLFLNQSTYSRFHRDIIFDSDSTGVKSSRIGGFHVDMPKTSTQAKAITEAERWYKDISGPLSGKVVASAYVYPLYDQYRIIIPETLTAFAMCLVAVSLVGAVVLIHPILVGLLVCNLLLIFLVLTACVNMWGLEMNSLTSICLIMAMGLVVDYSAHIMHNFAIQDPWLSRNDRVANAIEEIGPAIGQGALSTFLAILPLAMSKSNTFRVFFKMFFVIVVVGFIHALVLAPVLLSFVGPSRHRAREMDVEEKSETSVNPETE